MLTKLQIKSNKQPTITTQRFILFLLFIIVTGMMISCSGQPSNLHGLDPQPAGDMYYPGGDEFLEIDELGFTNTSIEPTVTVSLDSSTAGYGYFRNAIKNGQTLTKNQVIIEDMINYFNYDYKRPIGKPLGLYAEVGSCPWNQGSLLLSVATVAQEIELSQTNGNNLVFLIDVSGSMSSRLDLIKESFRLLVDQLQPNDTVSLVTYNDQTQTVFTGYRGNQKVAILEKISQLTASGGTHFSNAIEKCYNIAEKYKIVGGNNRIILATDGDFNIGITSNNNLAEYMKSKANAGVYLTVCGFGMGNYKNDKMEILAQNGQGNAFYIDTLNEAKKSFLSEVGATLVTVATDVKAQVTFNCEAVKYYRVLGYENQLLDNSDYEDDDKDAGEINSGHVVMVLFEIIMEDNYQEVTSDWGQFGVKYKNPHDLDDPQKVYEITVNFNLDTYLAGQSYNFHFASCVAEVGLLLRNSVFKANASYFNVHSRLEQLLAIKSDEYKEEFLELIKTLREQIKQ